MNAIDTNLLVYSIDVDEPVRCARAINLIDQLIQKPSETIILWQVAVEFLCCLRKWESQHRISADDVSAHMHDWLVMFPLIFPSRDVIGISFNLSTHYSLSHWDSLLIAACIDAGVETLYSEDIDAGMQYGSVTVVDPFA